METRGADCAVNHPRAAEKGRTRHETQSHALTDCSSSDWSPAGLKEVKEMDIEIC